ncbi:ABC transporter ATP-binding protein [Phyllobacterium leguminum]|uniref:Lipopolysaccharide transport system ATP-binding protein n=1 Tax=Phyllobacterium leguminum TaxID=314237 RepID=A0A318SXV8_9HYPH|nr:ABC transporter ATP-binding protein [Phyllobacterium leguminum]PYE85239.1 lipopolysaccharide transport system ATP-binding protein [Phyllobacterium leguminum]
MNDHAIYQLPVAVEARNLGKSYRKHKSSVARIMDFANYLLRGRRSSRFFETSHVLRDIELAVREGRSLGIIGQNGCGKSTLLKMVASIISPTSGTLKVNGRVASIIELGAGFNFEDTGLQNIYSYLTMYAIPSAAIQEKVRQIIEFSGLGEKISAPVKSYSSGMVVRLAFAIIAHLDADILLVDEALAVGDAVFSQKCMRFIQTFKQHGTILFVSHDLNALQAICDEVIWLHDGVIRARGPARPVCDAYLEFTLSADYPDLVPQGHALPQKLPSSLTTIAEMTLDAPTARVEISPEPDLSRGFGGSKAEIVDVALRSITGKEIGVLKGGETVELAIRAQVKVEVSSPIFGFIVKNSRGVEIFAENTLHDLQNGPLYFEAGVQYEAVFRFSFPILPSGDYTVTAAVGEGDFYQHKQLIWRHDVLVLRVASERFRYGLIGLNDTRVSVYRHEMELG